MLTRLCLALAAASLLLAQPEVRPVPPPGVAVPEADRAQLTAGLERLADSLGKLKGSTLLPDVQVFYDAVRLALKHDEFFKPEEIGRAKELLRQGQARADDLLAGRSPWTTATGLVVRGYVSRIDRSVQPYALVVPPSFSPQLPRRWRLDCWFHGRAETLSEVNFLYDRQRQPGEFTPTDTIVLHLYGRHNNANKFAGEVDLFEAMDAVKRQYAIDENRIVVRGFSMGGAAAWQFATHFAGDWVAAAPGAGFSETPDFLKGFQKETVRPTWWEEKLWHLYNATDYAANLYNCPTVAYSGEIDRQKQAADMMEKALAEEDMRLTHIIGPQTAHRYHPGAKVTIDRLIDAIAARGRDPFPRKIRFTTFTLRYNRMKWLTVDALEKHWERARLDAEVTNDRTVTVKSQNVTAFTLNMGPGAALLDPAGSIDVVVDGQKVAVAGPMSDRSWTASLHRVDGRWASGLTSSDLRKRHGLQGPIDDAFMDSFLIVRPTGKPMAPGIAGWVDAEMTRAIREWRRHFRGEPQVRNDVDITDADIANNNLALWGDPGSNRVLARLADKLPVRWSGGKLLAGKQSFDSGHHAPLLVYPNPLHPGRYVVVNSGFTYREYDYLNNAREVPKLPDYAIVDTTTAPDARYPGKIVTAGFFNERWQWQE